MSVIGIDLGNLASKIGVARKRGIDIIVNEVSNRATPSLVSFGPKARAIGEPAKTQETSNFKNTIGSLKRLVGRTLNDPEVQNVEKKFINAELVDAGGEVGVKVRFLGEEHVFSATQLLGMYLSKLRDTAAHELQSVVSDVVISVPGWFTDAQRRAYLDAADIANLNPLRLINDNTAAALGYGITKTDLPEADAPRHVVFIDIGHSNYQVSVVAFAKGQLTIKGTAFERNFGGRDFDLALLKHFAEEFKAKYKIDVLSNQKAVFRLLAGCERVKKVLSANAVAPLNVESIMNDIDASSQIKREEFEALISGLLAKVNVPLERVLTEAGIDKSEVHSVEMVGGSTRIPALKERISAFFGKPLSFTLNQDEAVARGATLACAMLSPVFKVREFSVHDIEPYPIKFTWEATPGIPDEDTELLVFQKNNPIPSTKILTFYRKEPFVLEASYATDEIPPVNPFIGRFSIKNVAPNSQGDFSIVKVKARLNLHGVLSVEGAYIVEEVEKEEEVPVEGDAMDTTKEGEEAAKPKTEIRKVKKLVRKADLPVVAQLPSKDSSVVSEFKQKEGELHANDKLVQDTEDRKNALEEYVYDQRAKIEDRYVPFIQPQEKEEYQKMLADAEDWLYSEEGEDATKSTYVSRLENLQKIGGPVTFRWKEHEERPKAAAQLRETLNTLMEQATSEDEKYSHIEEKDKQSVVEKCATVGKWLEDNMVKQNERAKNQDPTLTSAEINKQREDVVIHGTSILNRPKPRAPKPDSAPKSEPASGQQTPQQEKEGGKTEEGGKATPQEMDVD